MLQDLARPSRWHSSVLTFAVFLLLLTPEGSSFSFELQVFVAPPPRCASRGVSPISKPHWPFSCGPGTHGVDL